MSSMPRPHIPAGPPWDRWFPVAVAGTPDDWELRRFEQVTESGAPRGASSVFKDRRGQVLTFRGEHKAAAYADKLNRAETRSHA